MSWLTDEEEARSATVRVVGAGTDHEETVEAGADFAETMKRLAREAGAKDFRVFENRTELFPDTAPATIQADARYMVRIEDKGA